MLVKIEVVSAEDVVNSIWMNPKLILSLTKSENVNGIHNKKCKTVIESETYNMESTEDMDDLAARINLSTS